MAVAVSHTALGSLRCLAPRSLPQTQTRGCPPSNRSSTRKTSQPRCQAPPTGSAAAGAYPGDSESWRPAEGSPPPEVCLDWQQREDASAAGAGPTEVRRAMEFGGPLAAIRSACLAYDRAVKSRPVLTKALTSFTGFAVGDRIAQSVTGDLYDPYRCLRLSLYGLLLDGPVGHAWYKLLDKYVYPEDPTCNQSVLMKTALDQLVWGPLMTLVFFSFLKTLEDHPELILATIQQRFWPTMIANYALWPLAHLVNFKFVPTDYRILFNNVVAIFWTTYLSFTCGPPTVVSGGGSGGVDVAAAAASALLSTLPCHKVEGAMLMPGVGEAMRQVAGIERMLSHWGTQSLPSADLLVSYLEMKAEVMKSVCQQPIRLPPS